MDKLLYKIETIKGQEVYTIRTIQSYFFTGGILMVFVGILWFRPIAYVGISLVILNAVSKALAGRTTAKLLKLHKRGYLTAKGSKYSFKNPMTFINHNKIIE